MRRASASPCSPVQALALPEQMTMARASARGSRSRLTCTGAAQTRFCVNTPGGGGRAVADDHRQVAPVRLGAQPADDARVPVAAGQVPVAHASIVSGGKSGRKRRRDLPRKMDGDCTGREGWESENASTFRYFIRRLMVLSVSSTTMVT